MNKIIHAGAQLAFIRRQYPQIAFCTGCFDMLHPGHLSFLEKCALPGHALVVCVGNDETVKALKGAGRPIYRAEDRARMLAGLEIVNHVTICETNGALGHAMIMQQLRPDAYIVPADDPLLKEKRKLALMYGGHLVVEDSRPYPHPHSTTGIVEKIEAGVL